MSIEQYMIDFPKVAQAHKIDVVTLIRQYHDIMNQVRKEEPHIPDCCVIKTAYIRTQTWLKAYHPVG